MKNKKLILEIIGWYGTVGIMGAYALNSMGLIESDSITYQLLNLTGAIGIIVISGYKKVFQSVALNTIWAFIAVIAIINIIT